MFPLLIIHIIGNIPTWVWPAIAGAGYGAWIVTGILSHFPNIKTYAVVIKPVCIIITIFGIFMYGGAGVISIYQAEIQAMEKKVAIAEQKSDDANKLIEQKSKQKIKVIHDRQIVYKERIKEIEKRIDQECKFDKDALDVLNNAALNPLKSNK